MLPARFFFGSLTVAVFALLTISSLVFVPPAQASARIAPIYLDIGPGGRGVVRVTNLRGRSVLYQLTPYAWQVVDGVDQHQDTADFIASPPSFSLAPNETREVRVGFRNVRRAPLERTYRLVIREVPADLEPQAGTESAISMAFTYLVPVFIAPADRPAAELVWSVRRDGDQMIVRAENHGNRRAAAGDLGFGRDGDELRWSVQDRMHVLAQSAREWTVKVPVGVEPGPLFVRTGRTRELVEVPVSR